jgi:hypothetical protein
MNRATIRSENYRSWEAYTGSPHFSDGDRRQDFDNGWDEAIELLTCKGCAHIPTHRGGKCSSPSCPCDLSWVTNTQVLGQEGQ